MIEGTPHLKRVIDTKPPHDLIRVERCTCSVGKDHSEWGRK